MAAGDTQSGRGSSRWNVISALMPALGFLVAVLSWIGGVLEMLGAGSHSMDQGAAALAVWCAFGLPGIVAAVISLARSERPTGTTAVAFLLNGLLVVGFFLLGGFAGEHRDHLVPYVVLACAAVVIIGSFWPRPE
jgi:hypothetical protein